MHLTSRTILIADDHAATRSVLRELCEIDGWRVVEARDGLEVVERAKECKPAVVLTDLVMPVIDGVEGARRLRADPELKQTVIIAVTGLSLSRRQVDRLERLFDAVLRKPIRASALRKRLDAARSRRPAFSSDREDTRPD